MIHNIGISITNYVFYVLTNADIFYLHLTIYTAVVIIAWLIWEIKYA
jgi:hypothetical protein